MTSPSGLTTFWISLPLYLCLFLSVSLWLALLDKRHPTRFYKRRNRSSCLTVSFTHPSGQLPDKGLQMSKSPFLSVSDSMCLSPKRIQMIISSFKVLSQWQKLLLLSVSVSVTNCNSPIWINVGERETTRDSIFFSLFVSQPLWINTIRNESHNDKIAFLHCFFVNVSVCYRREY